jgi:carbon storage regulator CsrA
MLILSRRLFEGVTIKVGGETVRVYVTDMSPGSGKIRLGFEAGENVLILRNELMPRTPAAPVRLQP